MTSLNHRLRTTNNRPAGFDYLRIGLSLMILVYHTVVVCYGRGAERELWTGPLRPFWAALVPSFFSLSGFLVAGSLLRNDLPSFLTLRGIRIAPALFCEVVISAFILGPLLTESSLPEYFSNDLFWNYLRNVIGDIHYLLPGVFKQNHIDVVNLQLWTIPFELDCYLVITLLALLKITKSSQRFLAVLVTCVLLAVANAAFRTSFQRVAAAPEGLVDVLAFLSGVFIFLAKDRIPYSKRLFAAASISAWILFSFVQTSYFAVVFVAYITVYAGLQNPRKSLIVAGADYSYGVYLYGFPIQQSLFQLGLRSWYTNLPASILLAFGAAYCSWVWVESRVLRQRTQILSFVSRIRTTVRVALTSS